MSNPGDNTAIYTITCFKLLDSENDRWRTWGWYRNWSDANDAVLKNATDMFEGGYYNMAVVEKVEEGILPICGEHWWYKAFFEASDNKMKVERWGRPAQLEHICNFSMG